MVEDEMTITDFNPAKVSVYAPITLKLSGMKQGEWVRLKAESRYLANKIAMGVRADARKAGLTISTQREDGWLYIYNMTRGVSQMSGRF